MLAWVHCTVAALALGACATAFVGNDPAARRALASKWLIEAVGKIERGDVAAAKSILIKAVELAPDHAEARNALGILLMIEGAPELAAVQFEWAAQSAPDVAAYQHHLALAYIAIDRVGFATPALNRALEIDPKYVPAKRTLLFAYMSLGRWDRAARLLEELRKDIKTFDPDLAYAEGMIAFAEERTDKARSSFEQVASAVTDSPVPVAALGLLYETLGFFDKAEAAYRTAAKRAPDDPYVALLAADLYYRLGRYNDAETSLRRAANLGTIRHSLNVTEAADLNMQIADSTFQTGKYRTSDLYKKRATALNPDLADKVIGPDASAHYGLGLVELERQNVDAAIREFRLSLQANPKFMLSWVRLAESLLLKAGLSPIDKRSQLLEQGRKAAAKAQELAPRVALGYYIEGKILWTWSDLQEGALRNGSLREALFAFQQARNAENPPADIPLYQAMILSDLDSHVEAAAHLRDAQDRDPKRFDLPFLRAAELTKAGKFKEAREALNEAYRIDAGNADLGPAMALVLFRLGDVDAAFAALRWKPGEKSPLPGTAGWVAPIASAGASATQPNPTPHPVDPRGK